MARLDLSRVVVGIAFTIALAACGSVPDIKFGDASTETGRTDASGDAGADDAESDAAACRATGELCTRNQDCCSDKCVGNNTCR